MSDYIVHDSSLTAVANAIRTQTGKENNLIFPTGFVADINSLAIKRGAIRHDAELIHTWAYDKMLVEDEGITIPAYTSSETRLFEPETSDVLSADYTLYDYRIILRSIAIPIYSEQAVIGPYWHEYVAAVFITDILSTQPYSFKGITLDKYAVGETVVSLPLASGMRTVLRSGDGDDLTVGTSTYYGIRPVNVGATSANSRITLNSPRVNIRSAAKSFPRDCWEAVEDVRFQYVFDVYRTPKRDSDLDGWGLQQEMLFVADCVNSADHKLR